MISNLSLPVCSCSIRRRQLGLGQCKIPQHQLLHVGNPATYKFPLELKVLGWSTRFWWSSLHRFPLQWWVFWWLKLKIKTVYLKKKKKKIFTIFHFVINYRHWKTCVEECSQNQAKENPHCETVKQKIEHKSGMVAVCAGACMQQRRAATRDDDDERVHELPKLKWMTM